MSRQRDDDCRRLVTDCELATMEVVANASMNRQRGIAGVNSYSRELRTDVLAFLRDRASQSAGMAGEVALPRTPARPVRWMDLCCGTGKALAEAAEHMGDLCAAGLLQIEGIDLMPIFAREARECPWLRLTSGDVHDWEPGTRYDLITCVHGLHYVGDRLALLVRAARALEPGGRLVANFDVAGVQVTGNRRCLPGMLRERGFTYDGRARLVSRSGEALPSSITDLPLHYLGTDPLAGPNYTHQPVVRAWYEKAPPTRE